MRDRKKLLLFTTERLLNSVATFVERRNYCRVGLVGMLVHCKGIKGPCTIHKTKWTGYRHLSLLIEPEEECDGETFIVPAENCLLYEDWPVTCCAPPMTCVAQVETHPLEEIVGQSLWEKSLQEPASVALALRISRADDEFAESFRRVAEEVLEVLHSQGKAKRDEKGLYSLADPTCPTELTGVEPIRRTVEEAARL